MLKFPLSWVYDMRMTAERPTGWEQVALQQVKAIRANERKTLSQTWGFVLGFVVDVDAFADKIWDTNTKERIRVFSRSIRDTVSLGLIKTV